jgi:hypothetical protein
MGVIYSPHLKRAIGGIFRRTSPVELSRSHCKSLETGLRLDMSRGGSLGAGIGL